MVSWAGDGTMAGYDPVTKRLKKGLYKFASPGTVDLQAVTRLGYDMGAGLSRTTYPNGLQITAPFTFTAADFSANGITPTDNNRGPYFAAQMVVVRANNFPEGHRPTPQEIWNLPQSKMAFIQRSTRVVYGSGQSYTYTYNIEGTTTGGWEWNTKWWVLVFPARVVNVNNAWSKANNGPMKGPSLNSIGRVVSFWSNRTPAKPGFASPPNGSTHLPGTEFLLQLDPNDPDAVPPNDAYKFNLDVNGVEFQYRAAPTAEDPDPPWRGLPFDWAWTLSNGDEYLTRDYNGAWYIRGSRSHNGLAATPYHQKLVSALGLRVVAGGGDSYNDRQPGKGSLPTGEWQIRARTFDYGHPYPNLGTKTTEPGPLGINPANNWILFPENEVYPEQNRSPWSDPLRISIPTQVPPPLVVSPSDSQAVSGNNDTGSIRLRWQYRNTHQPPRDQFQRIVQIRKVGDPEWSTIFNGPGSEPYVDLPYSLEQDDIPPLELIQNGGFEESPLNTGPWMPTAAGSEWDEVFGDVLTELLITGFGEQYEGDWALEIRNTWPVETEYPAASSITYAVFQDIPEEYQEFHFDGWAKVPADDQGFLVLQLLWLDENNEILNFPNIGEGEVDWGWPYASLLQTRPAEPGEPDLGGWTRISDMTPLSGDFDRLSIRRHPLGKTLVAYVNPGTNLAGTKRIGSWLFDNLSFSAQGTGLDSFTLEIGNQYEWRVQVTDTDSIVSAFSAPGRFWLIPGEGSGETRPVPVETLEGAVLGCGKHTVEVYKRGGVERIGVLSNVSHVDWGRMRDDISTAQVVVSGWDVDCGNLLAKLQSWAYELVIWRDNGYSNDRVWEGPITLLTYEADKVTIDAKDVMGYAYRRILRQKMTDSGTGNGTTVVDRARRVLQNAFAPDDPNVLGYLQIIERSDDAMQYRSTPAYSRTAHEEIDDMAANAGLDYTTVGRAILVWGTKNRIGTLPEFRDSDLGNSPIVSEYGMSTATAYSVSDGNGVHGEAYRGSDPVSGNDEHYGLVEMLSSTWASDSENDTGTYTQAGLATIIKSFKESADRSIAARFPPPVIVRVPDNTPLNPDTVISIQHLVPGVVIPLRSNSTLRTVVQSQKLDSVKVIEEGGKETISITLSAFTRDDAALGEGEE